jgi:hypothetical protein
MSSSAVIADVTDTLQNVLKTQQQPIVSFTISLKSPADETADTGGKVNLFLLRVLENPFAKNQDWQPVGLDGLEYPPLALNLLYLVTPFAQGRLDEHRVLGEAMRVLYDHSIIKAPLLKGLLENTAEQLNVDLCPFNLEELTKIWNAFNKPYRLSVAYEVRMVLIDSTNLRPIGRVSEKIDTYSPLQ